MAVDADASVDELSPPLCDETQSEAVYVDKTLAAHAGVRLALVMGITMVLSLSGLLAWLGFRVYESHHVQQQRQLIIQVARQGALNLTTIDHTRAEADVQRILDSSAGTFHDDFQMRSAPFIDVVKRTQSTSEGSITEAALESVDGDQAQVLVAVDVKTSNAGAVEPQPRAWRMRISVQKTGDDAKVVNVEFVP